MKSSKENKTSGKSTKKPAITKNASGEEHSEFPGYPLYAPEEDMMNKGKRIEVDLDSSSSVDKLNADLFKKSQADKISSDKIMDNKSELTKEDFEALGPKDLSLDMGEDEELLKHRIYPVDFSGKDIDVPGSELDDKSEAIGSEDEENNVYSIGGDRHEDLEEDKA